MNKKLFKILSISALFTSIVIPPVNAMELQEEESIDIIEQHTNLSKNKKIIKQFIEEYVKKDSNNFNDFRRISWLDKDEDTRAKNMGSKAINDIYKALEFVCSYKGEKIKKDKKYSKSVNNFFGNIVQLRNFLNEYKDRIKNILFVEDDKDVEDLIKQIRLLDLTRESTLSDVNENTNTNISMNTFGTPKKNGSLLDENIDKILRDQSLFCSPSKSKSIESKFITYAPKKKEKEKDEPIDKGLIGKKLSFDPELDFSCYNMLKDKRLFSNSSESKSITFSPKKKEKNFIGKKHFIEGKDLFGVKPKSKF